MTEEDERAREESLSGNKPQRETVEGTDGSFPKKRTARGKGESIETLSKENEQEGEARNQARNDI